MPLSTDEYGKVKEWLDAHPISAKCPICLEAAKWETGELVGVPLKSDDAYHVDERSIHVTNVPLLQIICTSCGYVAHFSAKKVGLR